MSAPDQDLLGRVEALVAQLQDVKDLAAREAARELLRAVLELHGAALTKVVSMLAEAKAHALYEKLGVDPLVGSVLALHGLHPAELSSRVEAGLERTRTYLKLNGCGAELVKLQAGRAHVRLVKHDAAGCSASPEKLRASIEQAMAESAPDLLELQIEEVSLVEPGFVPLSRLTEAKR